MNIGLNTRVISSKIVRMDKESYFYPTVKFLREISRKIWFGEKEYS